MGNRKTVPLEGGYAEFLISGVPSALVFMNAQCVDPCEEELMSGQENALPQINVSRTGLSTPTFVLNRADQVKNLWEGNPQTEHRIWKGVEDLSAEISLEQVCRGWWFWRKRMLRVNAVVVDDLHVESSPVDPTSGDFMQIRIGDNMLRAAPTCRENGYSLYGLDVPVPDPEVKCSITVYDDDGEGRDGWISTGDFNVVSDRE